MPKIIVDGVLYVPVPNSITDKSMLAALDVRFESRIFNGSPNDITIRDYLRELLITVWVEREGFNGKRPFGNSSWEYDLYIPLARAGFIQCNGFDDDGWLNPFNIEQKIAAHKYVRDLITVVFNGVNDV